MDDNFIFIAALIGVPFSVWLLVRVGAFAWFTEKERHISRVEKAHSGER